MRQVTLSAGQNIRGTLEKYWSLLMNFVSRSCPTLAVNPTVGSALLASRLCLPDTNWWLNGRIWAQDADLAWRRLHAGHRWRADILARLIWQSQKGHAAPRAKDVTSVPGSVWGGTDKMWVSPAWTHSSPGLFQSPFTINTGRKLQCSMFSYCYFIFQIKSQTKVLFCASSSTESPVC